MYLISNVAIVYKGHIMVSLIRNLFVSTAFTIKVSNRIIFQIIDFNFYSRIPKTIKIFSGNTILILVW